MKKQRKTTRLPFVDVEEVRHSTGLSVEDFAQRFGLTAASVRSWENGTTEPYGVGRILLAIIATHPEVVDEVLSPGKFRKPTSSFDPSASSNGPRVPT